MEVSTFSEGAVRVVELNRPYLRNAVDRPTAEALVAALTEFDNDESAAVAVLHGRGGTFCSGADLTAFGGPRQNRLHETGAAPMGPSRLRLSKPIVAAIEGYAVAGGLELAAWCDLRVAARDARLGVLCRRWGVPLIDGGTVRLPRLIGHSHAMDLILTGREVDAEEALRMGLVNRLAESGQALQMALQLAERLATFPQECLRSDRLSAIEQWGESEQDALSREFARGLSIMADAAPGVRSFVEGAGRHGAP